MSRNQNRHLAARPLCIIIFGVLLLPSIFYFVQVQSDANGEQFLGARVLAQSGDTEQIHLPVIIGGSNQQASLETTATVEPTVMPTSTLLPSPTAISQPTPSVDALNKIVVLVIRPSVTVTCGPSEPKFSGCRKATFVSDCHVWTKR